MNNAEPKPPDEPSRRTLRGSCSQPTTAVPDPLTVAIAELHREIMEAFEAKWAMYGPDADESSTEAVKPTTSDPPHTS